MVSRYLTLSPAVIAALLTAPPAQAGGVLALNNKSGAAWALVVPAATAREPMTGTIQVEVLGTVTRTLRAGDRFALPAGFKGLLLFQRAGELLDLKFKLEDTNRKYQEFHVHLDANFNNQPHVTHGASNVFNVITAPTDTYLRDLATVMDFHQDQYSLSITAAAFPARR